MEWHLRATLQSLHHLLSRPMIAAILPDIIAEGARSPALAQALTDTIAGRRRSLGAAILRRAVDRDELPAGFDLELALDLMAGPLYLRALVRWTPSDPDYLDRLTAHLLRALDAASGPS